MRLSDQDKVRIDRILSAPNEMRALALAAGLDPAMDFQRGDWRGVDFGRDDLAGFDFSGAQLAGADFSRARGLRAEMFVGAIGMDEVRWPAGFSPLTTSEPTPPSKRRIPQADNEMPRPIVRPESAEADEADGADGTGEFRPSHDPSALFPEHLRHEFEAAVSRIGDQHVYVLLVGENPIKDRYTRLSIFEAYSADAVGAVPETWLTAVDVNLCEDMSAQELRDAALGRPASLEACALAILVLWRYIGDNYPEDLPYWASIHAHPAMFYVSGLRALLQDDDTAVVEISETSGYDADVVTALANDELVVWHIANRIFDAAQQALDRRRPGIAASNRLHVDWGFDENVEEWMPNRFVAT